jgi:hypothetical protein
VHIPQYYRATAIHARGFPRIDSILPRGILPAPKGDISNEEFSALFGHNRKLVARPGLLDVKLEKKGSKWPDFIGHWVYGRELLASERVCEALLREGIRGFEIIPTEFVQPLPAKLSEGNPPRYYVIKPLGKIKMRVDAYFLTNGHYQSLGSYLQPDEKHKAPEIKEGVCIISRPEGLEFADNVIFKVSDGFGCDRRVAEIAFREKWSNLQLGAFDSPWFPIMCTPSVPKIDCATNTIDTAWYTSLQEEALKQNVTIKPTRSFWSKLFGSR